jgi:hypothetical protein
MKIISLWRDDGTLTVQCVARTAALELKAKIQTIASGETPNIYP